MGGPPLELRGQSGVTVFVDGEDELVNVRVGETMLLEVDIQKQ